MSENIDKSKPMLPIGVVAEMFDISVQTLRLYENKGLIIPFKKDSKHRLYSLNDIDRLKCIRKLITEAKFSIESIRTMYSMIPCWAITNCSEEVRNNCDAFSNFNIPCWTITKQDSICSNQDCTSCKVYSGHTNCNQIKESIKEKTTNYKHIFNEQ